MAKLPIVLGLDGDMYCHGKVTATKYLLTDHVYAVLDTEILCANHITHVKGNRF